MILQNRFENSPILVTGTGKLVSSVAVCLLQAGHTVVVSTADPQAARMGIDLHLSDLRKEAEAYPLTITDALPDGGEFKLAIVLAAEELTLKRAAIAELERYFQAPVTLAITAESTLLSDLQQGSAFPAHIVGLNWVEPAHTTLFLEIISNEVTEKEQLNELESLARQAWNKDPYLIQGERGIRSRMMSALLREAFYLVGNGYATVEDIDRACRNDAGYYFPFAGNYRYMDLMGTYAYGMVMKDLNPELSNAQFPPAFFTEKLNSGALGMEAGEGFYDYTKGEPEQWQKVIRTFSFAIKDIMDKYPFNYKESDQP